MTALAVTADQRAAAIATVEAELAGLPQIEQGAGWLASRERFMAACDAMIDRLSADPLGARIADDWNGARVRMLGIASTSTAGVPAALRNWVVAARRRT